MPTLSRRQVYVFDWAVPNLQALINAVGPDQQTIIPDSASDGFLQLAKTLEIETVLDAIDRRSVHWPFPLQRYPEGKKPTCQSLSLD